ncbi:hypothetical protein [Rhodococcus sp. YH3-3]|uniref:hypothetical protein n=1 Tax=Rhodococcus sp. YH3-3 TaxID=1803579 RepID=UPI0007DAFC78|nr:hypothetical protein [Rhodococcus sp. YH3-3]
MAETIIPTVADIDAEIVDATAAVEDLETKVINGDTAVTSTAISKAREKLNFLGLRRKAAEKAEADAAEAERRNAIEAHNKAVAEWNEPGLAEMQDEYAAIVSSIRNLQNLIETRHSAVRRFEAEAKRLGLPKPKLRDPSKDYIDYACNEGRTGIRREIGFVTDKSGRHCLHRD